MKNQTLKTIYLDSASTTPTPPVVLDAMNEYYQYFRANVHRGIYDAGIQATEAYEGARKKVAGFIHASSEEIIFTSGTTAALNQLAYSLSPRLSHRDNVVLTRMEHHANLVPWQQMAKHYGFELRFIELTDDYQIDLTSAAQLIDKDTKVISFTLASNVLGTIAPAQELIALGKNVRAITIIDAAQAVAHIPINVRQLNCDFLIFSGHKMYGPTGIGVLYGKKVLLEESLEPFFFGGEMVKEVNYKDARWNDLPWKFEAGTPNIAGAIGLGAAVEFILEYGWEKITAHEQAITKKLIEGLKNCGATIVGPATNRIGVVSFTLPGIHPHDIAEILNQEGIAVRAGFHCAEPLHDYLAFNGTTRVSIGIYNTEEEIEKLLKGIQKAKRIFQSPLPATS